MTEITDERLAEMVGAGVPCVPAQPGEIAAVVQELRTLRSKPVAGVEVKPLDIADTCDGVEQDAFEAWAASEKYEMHEHPLHYLFLDPRTDAARMGWKAGLLHARQRILSTLLPKATAPVVSKPAANKGEQRTICEACGNSNLAHGRAIWTDDGSSFCPSCAPQPEAVITYEMVERLRAGIISASGSWHPSLNQCRDLLAALKGA